MSLIYIRGVSEQQNVVAFPVIAAVATLPVRSKLLTEMAPIRGANEQE